MSLTAVAMDVASEDSTHQIPPLAPNMCITPAAPSPLPMPYPIIGDTGRLASGTEKTKVKGKKVLTLKGKTQMCSGNEAGVQKDIITFTTKGKAFALVGAPVVMFEGAMVVITGSPGFGNAM